MKNILVLKQSSQKKGGLEKYTSKVIQSLQEKNCTVTVLSSSPLTDLSSNLKQISPPKPLVPSLFRFQEIERFDRFCLKHMHKIPYDSIIGMERNSFQTHLRAGNGVHAAYLRLRKTREGYFKQASFALNPLHHLLLNLEKKAFEHPDLRALVVNSTFVYNQVLEHYNIDPKKVHVIHNGVEWTEWESYFVKWEEKRDPLLDSFKLDKDVYHFLFIGHDFKRKGLKQLLQALSLLKLPFHLSIIGEDKKAPFYQQLTHQLGLSKKVSFFGKTPLTPLFYQCADCLVIPSLYDPFANVTIEALAMGLYVISSPFNGGSEVIQEGCGTVLPSLEIEALATALKKAIEHPKNLSSAQKIRNSVKHLDFPHQLSKFCSLCLS